MLKNHFCLCFQLHPGFLLISARMRSHGLVREEVEQQQQPTQPVASAANVESIVPAEEGVDSVGPSLCLPNGKPISPSALPAGASRAALQKAILTQESERLLFSLIFRRLTANLVHSFPVNHSHFCDICFTEVEE